MKTLMCLLLGVILSCAGCKEIVLKPVAAYDVVKGFPGNSYSPEQTLVVSHYWLIPDLQLVVRRGFVEVDLSKIPTTFKVSSVILHAKFDMDVGVVYILPVTGRPTEVLQGNWAGPMFDSLGGGQVENWGLLDNSNILLNDNATDSLQTAISSGQGWWALGLRWEDEYGETDEAVTLSNVSLILIGG